MVLGQLFEAGEQDLRLHFAIDFLLVLADDDLPGRFAGAEARDC